MSGGSFDYLSTAELDRVLGMGWWAERMADELDALGFADLAAATRTWFTEAGEQRRQLEARLAILQDAWHGVEWWRSADWSEADAVIACAAADARLKAAAR